MPLTDAQRMWKLANRAGTRGVHSHDLRREGITGQPSQRAKDIADHVPFWTRREARNGRPGSRYWADGFQPSDAVAVRPNGPESGGTAGKHAPSGTAALRVEAAPEQVGVKEPVALVRDYDRDPHGPWREVPVSELGLSEAA